MTRQEILQALGRYADRLAEGRQTFPELSAETNSGNCLVAAFLNLYKATGNEKYLTFSRNILESSVPGDYTQAPSLTSFGAGKNLLTLYDLTGMPRYRDAVEVFRRHMDRLPRTREGVFRRASGVIQLEDTYAVHPFYMAYETRFNGMKGCLDSYRQFMNIKKYMQDPVTGLYDHGRDETLRMPWANRETGCSPYVVMSSMGWFLAAMADVLEGMDEQLYYEYRGIMAMLKDAADALLPFQEPESGLFRRIIGQPDMPGNDPETSGTFLFAYSVLKGVRLGYLPKRFIACGEKAFYGSCCRCLSPDNGGQVRFSGVSPEFDLSSVGSSRDLLPCYLGQLPLQNNLSGLGPMMLAYAEMLTPRKAVW